MKLKLTLFFTMFCSLIIYSQNIVVSGTITDKENGDPLPGVNIAVKDTAKGAISDFDGHFTLKDLEKGAVLQVTYLGYVSQNIVVNSSKDLLLELEPDLAKLDEVVIIGYGTQKKKEVTGAVSIIDSKTIEKLKPTRIEQALQGQVAGVNITSNSGSPGSASNIRIRGVSTNGKNQPLILVDGNVIEDLSVINPSDIKSINVLKDATAGIYGVRAANGVILITTKSGRKGSDLKFQFDAYTGIQTTSKKVDLLGAADFARYVNDAAGQTEYFVYPTDGTDWQDEVFETAPIHNVNLSGSGGTEKSAYTFGISYLDQDGIVGGDKSNYNRLTARLGYQYDILDNLKISATGLHTISEKNNLQEGGIGSPLYNALNVNPDLAVRDENGDFSLVNKISQIEIVNPVAQIANTYNTTRVTKVSGTIGLDYTFLEHFKASSKFQINSANVRNDVFRPEVNFGANRNGTLGNPNDEFTTNEVDDFGDDFNDFTWDNYLTYTNSFKEKHNLTVLLGTSIFRTKGFYYGYKGTTENGNNSIDQTVWDMEDVENRFTEPDLALGNNQFDSRLFSIFSRVQYDYNSKYLLSFVMRRDASSRFLKGTNIGYFPSGSIGWNISEENFFNTDSWVNALKLRASYGVIGNDRIDDNSYLSILNGNGTYVDSNNELISGIAQGAIGNEDLVWEKQKTGNIGLDASFFNRKVSISFDAFSRLTEDLLIRPETSGTLGGAAPGSSAPYVNAGTVENKGLEFRIGYNDNINDNFKFNISYNISTLHNEVLSVDVNENGIITGGNFGLDKFTSRMQKGFPMGYFYGYKTAGLYQTQAEINALNASVPFQDYQDGAQPGDLKFVDVNGDGKIDVDDQTNLGDPIPNVTMGLNLGFNYKNLDFSSSVYVSLGNDMVRDYERVDLYTNKSARTIERWQGSGTSNFVHRASSGSSSNTDVFSDYYVEDASFLRLQNVQLGYSLNPKTIESWGLDKFRIYVSGNNLVTLTDYLGYDPSASSGDPIGGGVDKGFYPVAKSYLLGVNLNF